MNIKKAVTDHPILEVLAERWSPYGFEDRPVLDGLHPLAAGARVAFGKGKPTVTDGPFIKAQEVLGGYWMVEAKSKEELVKWAQRCPAEPGDVIEIRQIWDEADFAINK